MILLFFFITTVVMMVVVPSRIIKRHGRGPLPYKGSLRVGIVLVVHWVLWLSGFYAFLPDRVADTVFLPVWFVLCVLGVVFAWGEFKNNAAFAVPLAGLSFISFVFALFLEGVSQM